MLSSVFRCHSLSVNRPIDGLTLKYLSNTGIVRKSDPHMKHSKQPFLPYLHRRKTTTVGPSPFARVKLALLLLWARCDSWPSSREGPLKGRLTFFLICICATEIWGFNDWPIDSPTCLNFRIALQIVNIHKYIALYGLRFTKEDHVFVIQVKGWCVLLM